MFTAYLKYISLLLFSGLILTFYCIKKQQTRERKSVGAVCVDKANRQRAFSFLEDVILPVFPALNKDYLLPRK